MRTSPAVPNRRESLPIAVSLDRTTCLAQADAVLRNELVCHRVEEHPQLLDQMHQRQLLRVKLLLGGGYRRRLGSQPTHAARELRHADLFTPGVVAPSLHQ